MLTSNSPPVLNIIRTRILDANSPHVDAMTGATEQSEAVKKAVSKAIDHLLQSAAAWKKAAILSGTQSYDVVVVGSGGAGLAAAIQACDEGAKVRDHGENVYHRRQHH
jgi:fumarate reductase flavoprotein subunit